MDRAERLASADSKSTKSFLRDRDVPPSESCASASPPVCMSAPEFSRPHKATIEKLLAKLKVDKCRILTQDVTAKVSLVSLLDEVSQLIGLKAIDILCGYWDKLTFYSQAVMPSGVPSTDCEERDGDHEDLATFVKSSRCVIERDAAMQETRSLLSFLCRHVSRSTYQTTFLKCDDDSCEHCVAHPVEAVKAVNLLRSYGGGLFTSTPSVPVHILLATRHYCT